jgi:hypothetical protein
MLGNKKTRSIEKMKGLAKTDAPRKHVRNVKGAKRSFTYVRSLMLWKLDVKRK